MSPVFIEILSSKLSDVKQLTGDATSYKALHLLYCRLKNDLKADKIFFCVTIQHDKIRREKSWNSTENRKFELRPRPWKGLRMRRTNLMANCDPAMEIN